MYKKKINDNLISGRAPAVRLPSGSTESHLLRPGVISLSLLIVNNLLLMEFYYTCSLFMFLKTNDYFVILTMLLYEIVNLKSCLILS